MGKEGNLSKNDLDPNDAFLVSAGALGIWVWLGKSATKAERQGVMQMGAKFIKDNKLPPQTALTRTFQGMEPDELVPLHGRPRRLVDDQIIRELELLLSIRNKNKKTKELCI